MSRRNVVALPFTWLLRSLRARLCLGMQYTSKRCTLRDRVLLVSGFTLCSCGQLSQSTPVAEFLPSGHFALGYRPDPPLPLVRAPIRGGSGNETNYRHMSRLVSQATPFWDWGCDHVVKQLFNIRASIYMCTCTYQG